MIMKTKLHFTQLLLASLLFSVMISCGSSQTAAQKQEVSEQVKEKVDNLKFTFKANYTYPSTFRSIYLSPYYDVKVSPDTVVAYLPYYGKAYTAPMNPSEGGIKFTSTSFEYNVREGKKKGNWLVDIKVKDKGDDVSLYFDIWDNGTARLNVSDSRRQSISFSGEIDMDK